MINEFVQNSTTRDLHRFYEMTMNERYSQMLMTAAGDVYEELVNREGLEDADYQLMRKINEELDSRMRDQYPRDEPIPHQPIW